MLKTLWVFTIFLLYTVDRGEGSVQLLTMQDSMPMALQALSGSGVPVAVAMSNELLNKVSGSVLEAENWLRSHVFAYYPATNISGVLVGHAVFCVKEKEDKLDLILPSIKNIHYALTRWGLNKEIKPSASFSSECLNSSSGLYRGDLAQSHIKPLLQYLQEIDSPYLVNPPQKFAQMSGDDLLSLLASHSESIVKLGDFSPSKITLVSSNSEEPKPTGRKLSFFHSDLSDPFPPRPTPIAPTIAPIDSSSPPSIAAKSPLPPLVGDASPPPFPLSFPPELPPMSNPATPPYGPHLPPCNPSSDAGAAAAPPDVWGRRNGLWCVAKPSVPPETLQEALNFACGEGGADCEAIRPRGSCFYPDTVVAHASYAFNSYWQKTKRDGGTCGFGGTAMLINSDPSFRHCRFILA